MSDETTNRYLIEIETVLRAQGADAAIAKLRELRAAQVDAAKASKGQAGDVGSVDSALAALAPKAQQASTALSGLSQAARGGTGSITGLARGLVNLRSTFAAIGPAMAAWVTGIGAAIVTAIALVRRFNQDAKAEQEAAARSADLIAAKLQERLAKIGEMKMEALRKEIDSITQSYARARDEADRLYTSQTKITDAELGAQLEANRLAEAEGKLTPEQRARADADARGAADERKLNLRQQNLETRAAAAQATLSQTPSQLAGLKGQQGAADQEYQVALKAALESGLVSPQQAELGDFSDPMAKLLREEIMAGSLLGSGGALNPFEQMNKKVRGEKRSQILELNRLYKAKQDIRSKTDPEIGRLMTVSAGAGAELADLEADSIVLSNDRAASRSGRRADLYGLDAATSAAAAGVAGAQQDTPEMAADRAGRFLAGSVLNQQRYGGVIYKGDVGRRTGTEARGALRVAVAQLQAPASDDAAIVAELFAKWEKMGARVTRSQAQIRRALDLLDGKIELQDDRSKAERAYTL